MKLARIALAAAAVALLAVFAGVGRPDAARSAPELDRSITVGGSGAVTVVPDRARFSFGVETRGRTAADALASNTAAMRKVIAALKAAGVADRDLQTQQVALSAVYSDDENQTVVGYAASNSIAVVVRELARAGMLIDRAVSAGANQVYGPSLERADRADFYRRALEAAVAEARVKAQTIASASGLTLGRPTIVQETSSAAPMPYAEARGAAPMESPPVEAGTQEITASVTVTFAAS